MVQLDGDPRRRWSDRDTGTAAPGIKFNLEVLPAGARFNFELVVEPEADQPSVALAVASCSRQYPAGRAGLPRGLGEVKLEDFTVHEVDLSQAGSACVPYLTRGKRGDHTGKQAVDRLYAILAGLMEGRHAA